MPGSLVIVDLHRDLEVVIFADMLGHLGDQIPSMSATTFSSTTAKKA